MYGKEMFKQLFAYIIFFYIVFSSAIAPAQEYRWVDDNGVLHFSDNPPPEDLKSKAPLIEDAEPHVKEPLQKPVQEIKPKEKTIVNKVPKVKEVPIKSQVPAKLYDIRGKVDHVEGVDILVLTTGERVKYVGVRNPSVYLAKNGLSYKMEEAVRFHKKLVEGKTVTVLLGKRKRDKEGNYLGHVFLGQQAFVNAELLKEGAAMTEEYPSDFEYQALFIRLQRDAQERGAGIWNY